MCSTESGLVVWYSWPSSGLGTGRGSLLATVLRERLGEAALIGRATILAVAHDAVVATVRGIVGVGVDHLPVRGLRAAVLTRASRVEQHVIWADGDVLELARVAVADLHRPRPTRETMYTRRHRRHQCRSQKASV